MNQTDFKPKWRVGKWNIDPERSLLAKGEEQRAIEPRYMRILVYLAEHQGKEISNAKLLKAGWRSKQISEDNLTIAISHLRKALDDEGRRSRYIKSINDRGYTLVAVVEKLDRPPTPETTGKRFWSRAWIWLVLIALALLVKAVLNNLEDQSLEEKDAAVKTLAVLPITAIGGEEDGATLAEGVTLRMESALEKLAHIKLVSADWSTGADGETPANPRDIATTLNLDALIEGTLDSSGEDLVLALQMTHLSTSRTLWTRRLTGPRQDIVAMQNQMATELTHHLTPASGPARPKPGPSEPQNGTNSVAYDYFLQGYKHLTEQNYQDAIGLFEQSIALDANYAEAQLGWALAKFRLSKVDLIGLRRALPEIKSHLYRAIELDPDLPPAYQVLGIILFLSEWDFPAAERQFLIALEKAPNDAQTHYWMSHFSLVFGRFEAAVFHLEEWRRLQPYQYAKDFAAWVYHLSGAFEEALGEMNAFEQTNPNPKQLHSAYVKIFENMGRDQEAFDHYMKMFELQHYSDEDIQAARGQYEFGGLAQLNRWLRDRFERRDVGQYEPPLSIARYCAASNDKENALNWLAQAASEKQIPVLWLNVDPKYDALRGDPKFKQLIENIGLDYR